MLWCEVAMKGRGEYEMSMIIPPKEILENIRCRNNSVYLVGEVTEEKNIFCKFKKELEGIFKRSRVEVEPDDSFKEETR